MVIASIITLLMFSLLGAFLAVGNLTQNRTNAFVDGTSTFYAAESGLNQRIASLNEALTNYDLPQGNSPGVAGQPVTAANISNCYSVAIGLKTSNDFECRNYLFNSTEDNHSFASDGYKTQSTSSAKINKYTAYTFIADNTTYNTATPPFPVLTVIPPGEEFEGLNAQNFKYTFYSTATKQDMSVGGNRGEAATVLQADTTIRRIPLFQFAYFSDIDMEFFVIDPQTTTGRVHTNGNLYLEHWGNTGTFLTFSGNVSATGDVYNRQDSAADLKTSFATYGFTNQATRMITGSSPAPELPLFGDAAVGTNPLTQTQLAPFNNRLKSGVKALKVPDMGFLRKRNYYTNNVSEYFGKADLRIEMFPDRAIPFAVTAIQARTGASDGTCVSTYTVGSDPAANYIDPNRQKNTGESFSCNQLNKGQLMSLAQPVLVVTKNAEEETRFCQAAVGGIERTRDTIGYADLTANATMAALTAAQKDKVLRALQTAIAGATTPIDYATVTKAGVLPAATQTVFGNLLADSTLNIGLNPGQISSLTAAPPANIAKARTSCFLPAPIAMVQKQDGTPGFFDRRERKLRTVLQTNLESLTIWNRDGRYVPMDNDLRTAPTISATDLTNSVNGAILYSTNQLLFLNAAANAAAPVGSFERLGLALADRTEGGLVLYETVNDNLSGDGSTGATNNIVKDTAKPIYKLKSDTSIARDSAGNQVILDYYRTGKGEAKGANSGHRAVSVSSAYAFAINGGRNIPGALTIASDRPMYLQGDYNTYADDRKPAAIIADTITALSGNCVSPGTTTDLLNIKTGQINCGTQNTSATASKPSPWTNRDTTANAVYDAATAQYNSAFVSNADPSIGNLGRTSSLARYMGGGGSQFLSTLENWRGYTLNATGAFVWFGSTIESDGAFIVEPTYSAYGTTNYAYDSNFNSFAQLPPLTPMAIYIKQDVFRRKY